MASESKFLEDLRAHIARKYVTQKMAAIHWGMTHTHLSRIVSGQKPPNEKILKEIGYTRTRQVVYKKVRKGD